MANHKDSIFTKEEAATPTVSMDLSMSQIIIDTFEERGMEIFDASGSYINADTPGDIFVSLKLEDDFANIM